MCLEEQKQLWDEELKHCKYKVLGEERPMKTWNGVVRRNIRLCNDRGLNLKEKKGKKDEWKDRIQKANLKILNEMFTKRTY